ncbi:hypothetical protein F5Y15DRAFT_367831 [Xylariaceae sp. FL0016]|nr:hypothetical protein F5Y15DRAFT_367831 [Xylariaceae sp. FL0016]
MLRSARPIFTSSSRAIAIPRQPTSSLRALSTINASNRVLANRPALHLLPTISKSQYATKSPGGFQVGVDPEEDKKLAQRKLKVHPESVTSDSTTRQFYEPEKQAKEKPVHEGVKADLDTVKETFSLESVPKESYYLGLAGTLPYLATSLSTVYLSWVINTPWPTTSSATNSVLIDHDTARQLLSTLEPIQLGYGAVIISFLGAIHWGMEYAEKAPSHARTRFRYGTGVLASVVAWPTLFMPTVFGLTAQFAAFVALYSADSRATVRGWAPRWYSNYRFTLTAIVGVAIALSLIGRAKVGDAQPRLTGLDAKFHDHRTEQDYSEKWQKLEQEEIEKKKKEKEEAEKKKKKEAKKAEKKNKKEGKKEGDKKEGEAKEDGEKKSDEKKEGGEKKSDEKKDGGEEKEDKK